MLSFEVQGKLRSPEITVSAAHDRLLSIFNVRDILCNANGFLADVTYDHAPFPLQVDEARKDTIFTGIRNCWNK